MRRLESLTGVGGVRKSWPGHGSGDARGEGNPDATRGLADRPPAQLSQDKPAEDAARVVAALDRTGHGDLAAAMRHRLTPTPTEDDT